MYLKNQKYLICSFILTLLFLVSCVSINNTNNLTELEKAKVNVESYTKSLTFLNSKIIELRNQYKDEKSVEIFIHADHILLKLTSLSITYAEYVKVWENSNNKPKYLNEYEIEIESLISIMFNTLQDYIERK